jgi:iron complex transport system ATP-binding protein
LNSQDLQNIDKFTVLKARDLSIGYRSGRGPAKIVADQINASLHEGEVICLMGPNGSGKSTLIKTLAGMQAPLSGDISLFYESVAALTPKEIAQKLSTVLTDRITIGNLDVFTLVSFGRSPYTGWLGRLREEDEKVVRWAIEATGVEPLVHRDISTLSDGERQKVMIARALAQDTDLILLDEPTAHLDLPNRVEIMRLLRKLARDTGKAILLSTHELDLALKAGDRCWLMNDERQLFSGTPEDLVLDGTFEAVFARDSFDFDRATGTFNLHEPNGKTIAVTGDTVGVFWTRRALEREGFAITERENCDLQIEVSSGGEDYFWEFLSGGINQRADSVGDLMRKLRNSRNAD